MAELTDTFDLGRMRMLPGEGRRFELEVELEPLEFGGETYPVVPSRVPVVLDVSRMNGGGYALRLRFSGRLTGPCMRCLEPASPSTSVDVREVDVPGGGEELTSGYMTDEELDVHAWARDAFALALPAQLLCREDCAGLCPKCGENLNDAGHHEHEPEPDPRWAALRELKLDQ